jgi:hypothetical protein
MNRNKFVLVNGIDNILVCCQVVVAGETVIINDKPYIMVTQIDVGHKIACKSIEKGQKILRYGVPIGSAITDIEIGEHVHLHNIKSDYIPSHTRQLSIGESKCKDI